MLTVSSLPVWTKKSQKFPKNNSKFSKGFQNLPTNFKIFKRSEIFQRSEDHLKFVKKNPKTSESLKIFTIIRKVSNNHEVTKQKSRTFSNRNFQKKIP